MLFCLGNLLCDKADDVYNGRLPYHVRLLLDEFANIGQIPKDELNTAKQRTSVTKQRKRRIPYL